MDVAYDGVTACDIGDGGAAEVVVGCRDLQDAVLEELERCGGRGRLGKGKYTIAVCACRRGYGASGGLVVYEGYGGRDGDDNRVDGRWRGRGR